MCADKKLSRIPYVRILNIDSIDCIAKSTKSDRMHSQTQSHYQSVYLDIKGELVKIDMIEADLKALVQWKIAESNEPQNYNKQLDDDESLIISDSEDDNDNRTSKTVNKEKKFKSSVPKIVVCDKISEKLLSAREGLSMCKLCDSVFVGSSAKLSLHRHITSNHGRTFTFKDRKLGEGYKAKSIDSSSKRKSSDSLENKETPTKSHNTQNYKCSFCDRSFDNIYGRDIHVRALHESIEKSPSSKTKNTSSSSFWPTVEKSSGHVCPTCGAKFAKKCFLMGHITRAHKSFHIEEAASTSESYTGHWLNAVSHSSSQETVHNDTSEEKEEEKYDSVTYNGRKSSDSSREKTKMDDSLGEKKKQDDSPRRKLKLDDTPPRKKVKLGHNKAKKINSVTEVKKDMSRVNLNNTIVLTCKLCSRVYCGAMAKYNLKRHMEQNHQNKKVSDTEANREHKNITKNNRGNKNSKSNHGNKNIVDSKSNHEKKNSIDLKSNHENKNSIDLKSNHENKMVTNQESNQVKSDVVASAASSNADIYSKYAWKCTSCNLPFTSSRGLHIHKARTNCNSTSLMYYVHTENNENRNSDIIQASSSASDSSVEIIERVATPKLDDTSHKKSTLSNKRIENTSTAVPPTSKAKIKKLNCKCSRCGKIFSNPANRWRHMKLVDCQGKTGETKKESMDPTVEDSAFDNDLQVVSAEKVYVRLERLPEPLNVKEFLTKYLAKVKSTDEANLQTSSASECLTEKCDKELNRGNESNSCINQELDSDAVAKDVSEISQDVPANYPVVDDIAKPGENTTRLTAKKLSSAQSSRKVATKSSRTHRSASALMESLSVHSSSSAQSSFDLETELLSTENENIASQNSVADVEESGSLTNVVTESESQCLVSAVTEALHSPRRPTASALMESLSVQSSASALMESLSAQSSANALMESLSAERSTSAVIEALHTQRSASALMKSLSAQMSTSTVSEFIVGQRSVSAVSSESADTAMPMSSKSSESKISEVESTNTKSSIMLSTMKDTKDSTAVSLHGIEYEQNDDSESNEVEPVDTVLKSTTSKSSKDITQHSNSCLGENDVHSTTTFPESEDTTVSSTTTNSLNATQNNNMEAEKENEMEEAGSGLESSGNVSISATFSSSMADTTSGSLCAGSESSTSVNGIGMSTALAGSV